MDERQSRRNILAAATAGCIGFTGFTLVMPFLPLYIAELGTTDVKEIAMWTGLTLGATPTVTAISAPLWGRVGDRYGALDNRSPVGRVRVSCDVRYQRASDPIDERYVGPNPRGTTGVGYGELNGAMAYMKGQLKVSGNVLLAQKMQAIFPQGK